MTNIAEGFERFIPPRNCSFTICLALPAARSARYPTSCSTLRYISDTEHEKLLDLVAQPGRLVSGLIRSTRARTADIPNSDLPSPIS